MAHDCADIIEEASQAAMERMSNSAVHVTGITDPVSDVPVPATDPDSSSASAPSNLRSKQLVPGTKRSHLARLAQDLHFPQEQHSVPTEDSAGPYDGFYPIGTVKNDPILGRMVVARLGDDFEFEFQPCDTDCTGHVIPPPKIHEEVWQTEQVKRAEELRDVTDFVVLAEEYQTTSFDELQIRLYNTMMRSDKKQNWPWRNGSDFVENPSLDIIAYHFDSLFLLRDVPDDMTLLDVIDAHGTLALQINDSISNVKNAMNALESGLREAQDPLEIEQAYAEVRDRITTELSAQLKAFIAYRKTSGSYKFTTPFAWKKRWEIIAGVRLARNRLSGKASPSQAQDPMLKGFSATATIKEIRRRFGDQTGEHEIGEEGNGEGVKVKENNSGIMELD